MMSSDKSESVRMVRTSVRSYISNSPSGDTTPPLNLEGLIDTTRTLHVSGGGNAIPVASNSVEENSTSLPRKVSAPISIYGSPSDNNPSFLHSPPRTRGEGRGWMSYLVHGINKDNDKDKEPSENTSSILSDPNFAKIIVNKASPQKSALSILLAQPKDSPGQSK